MLLDLLIRKFKDLKTVRVRCLSGFSLCKIVDNSLVREGLLDVFISEKYD